ncbi:MAG: hypothetical protein NZM44_00390 [Candidatus Calescibacterium sp.]|nr:hypothetical protein [Candidatus Calescibacterium sp.]
MAVVRDYLITQFTFYGISVFANQLKNMADAISEISISKQLEKANIDINTFRNRLAQSKGDFSYLEKSSGQLNNKLKNVLDSADKLQRNLASIPIQALPQTAQRSYATLTQRLDQIRDRASEAIVALSKGDMEKAQKELDKLSGTIEKANKNLSNIHRSATAARLGSAASKTKAEIAENISAFQGFLNFMNQEGLRAIDTNTKNTIERIGRVKNFLDNKIIPAIGGTAIAAITSFFLISRAIYNVIENLKEAYRVAIDLGIGLRGAFALTRGLQMFGFDVNVISQASMKLSEAITKNQLAGRLMIGWLGLSPYQLQGKDTLEAIDIVLDKIMRLPSTSLRKTIGKEILGERFPELLMMKELGYIETLKQMNVRYTEEYIKKVAEAAKMWAMVKMNIQDLGINLANSVLPVVEKIVALTNYLVENSAVLYGIITAIGVIALILKYPLVGIGLSTVGILGLIHSFKNDTNSNFSTISNELRAQTRIMDLQYRTLNTIRLQLNQFIATTARQTPNLYQASIYRSLLTNTGGI